MPTLPQLFEEDIREIQNVLQNLLSQCDATCALVIDKGGFLITHQGQSEQFDLTTLAALASGAYLANQSIAQLVHENNFDSVYQQGERFSLLVMNVDQHCLLVLIFTSGISAGSVKYYAAPASRRIAAQLHVAHERAPGEGLDLSILNVADTTAVFQRKRA